MRKNLYQDLFELEEKHWWHLSKRKVLLEIIKDLNLNKFRNPKILEIGCGTGKNLEVLDKFGKTLGLDISEEAIKFCRKRGLKNVSLGQAEKIPFPKDNFDLVVLLDVLEHTNDQKTIKEIHRILKSKGFLIVTAPAFPWLWSQWDVVLGHKRRYTLKGLAFILKREGFETKKISYMFSFLVVPAFFVRLIKSKFFKKDYRSDFRLSILFLNWIFLQFSNLERLILLKKGIPFGTSIICLAQKRQVNRTNRKNYPR